MALKLTDQDFKDKTAKGLVLVEFWADWCAPCHALAPILEQVEEEVKDKAVIAKLNVDVNPKTSMEHRVTSIPTVKLFKDGEVVEEFIGVNPKPTYIEMIKKHSS